MDNDTGTIYGTTQYGGGPVFELVKHGSDYSLRVLHRFTGPPDGAEPGFAGLAQGAGGAVFGTTRSGGTASDCADGGPGGVRGCGTVYRLTLSAG